MRRPISIIGYGALSEQILNLLNVPQDVELNIFDDIYYGGNTDNRFAHKFSEFDKDQFSNSAFYIGLGYKHLTLKRGILSGLLRLDKILPSFIHPSGYCDKNASIAPGVIVYPMCNIDKNVQIGAGTLVNNSVVISHDSIIGECCYISPAVTISGNVKVGNETFIGTGALVSNGITIGDNVTIGIGTVVTKDVSSNTTVLGNPMRVVEHKLNIL